jgi:hypothetical protein
MLDMYAGLESYHHLGETRYHLNGVLDKKPFHTYEAQVKLVLAFYIIHKSYITKKVIPTTYFSKHASYPHH